MSAPLLAGLRRGLADPVGWLGSWKLSVVLMVAAALYQGLLAIWAVSSPAPVVRGIASLLPFWIVWMGILANTGFCLWRRLPLLTRRDGIEDDAVARRRATLGTFLFHGAFFLVAAGFLLGLAGREERLLRVAVGEEFSGDESQVAAVTTSPLFRPAPWSGRFAVLAIRPEFWGNELLFTELAADLRLGDGRTARTRINRPLWLGWGTFLRLSGFGYAPRYEVVDPEGKVAESLFVRMNVFPPGQRDSFFLQRFPHRVYLEVIPDPVEQEGELLSASLNLRRPACRVRVFRGHLEVASGLLRTGESIDVEGLRLRFPEIAYWGEFSLVRDAGIPFLFLGMLLGMVGLGTKLAVAVRRSPGADPVGGEERT